MYKDGQDVQEYMGLSNVYKVYKSIMGEQEYTRLQEYTGYTGCTRVYGVHKGIQDVLEYTGYRRDYTGCTRYKQGAQINRGY